MKQSSQTDPLQAWNVPRNRINSAVPSGRVEWGPQNLGSGCCPSPDKGLLLGWPFGAFPPLMHSAWPAVSFEMLNESPQGEARGCTSLQALLQLGEVSPALPPPGSSGLQEERAWDSD